MLMQGKLCNELMAAIIMMYVAFIAHCIRIESIQSDQNDEVTKVSKALHVSG